MFKNTITITYGEQVENHAGMQKIGELSDKGFNLNDLTFAKNKFEENGCKCELINLRDKLSGDHYKNANDAYFLIIKNGVNVLLSDINKDVNDFYNEQNSLNTDKKAFMYGRVVNKKARHNLCFGAKSQEPDYENKKGTIISYDNVLLTKHIRDKLGEFVGDQAKNLNAEGNYYYDISKCGIGFHGDAERKKVIGIRLGLNMPLHFQWFYNSIPVGERSIFDFDNGDIYIMSEKTTGFDWKKRKILTLRHAAGCKNFLNI